MNLAIRLYSDVGVSQKPLGIPDAWPAQVVELGSSIVLPDDGHTWTLMTKEEYVIYTGAHQTEYTTWANTFYAPKTSDIIRKKILAARDFGMEIIINYATDNILAGKSTADLAEIGIQLQNIQMMLQTGSLYVSLKMMKEFTPSELVPSSTILKFGNQIRVYLGKATVASQDLLDS